PSLRGSRSAPAGRFRRQPGGAGAPPGPADRRGAADHRATAPALRSCVHGTGALLRRDYGGVTGAPRARARSAAAANTGAAKRDPGSGPRRSAGPLTPSAATTAVPMRTGALTLATPA